MSSIDTKAAEWRGLDASTLVEPTRWSGSPINVSAKSSTVAIQCRPGSDYWQKTHYGFVHDNGHAAGIKVAIVQEDPSGDLTFELCFRGKYTKQFDQGGVLLRKSPTDWIKAGLEFVDGSLRASAVVTRDGFSDWSTATLPDEWQEGLREGRDRYAVRLAWERARTSVRVWGRRVPGDSSGGGEAGPGAAGPSAGDGGAPDDSRSATAEAGARDSEPEWSLLRIAGCPTWGSSAVEGGKTDSAGGSTPDWVIGPMCCAPTSTSGSESDHSHPSTGGVASVSGASEEHAATEAASGVSGATAGFVCEFSGIRCRAAGVESEH